MREQAARHVETEAEQAFPGTKVKVDIGPVDTRLDLPACERPTFTLSAGSKPWGSGTLATRCDTPRPWQLYLTYKVALSGPGLIARRPLPAGASPTPADVTPAEVDYEGNPGFYFQDPERLRHSTLLRPLAAGSPVSASMLRMPPVIRAGQRVRAVYRGAGFTVGQEGIAQSQARPGDTLRLKIPSGRYIQGVVEVDGTLSIQP